MDRLTKERVEQLCYELDAHTTVPEEEVLALRDLALQSLSQEAVQDEALEEENELLKKALANFLLPSNITYPSRTAANNVHKFVLQLAKAYERALILLIATQRAYVADALKREPNAAAQAPLSVKTGSDAEADSRQVESATSACAKPAPAAPDVAEAIDWLNHQAEMYMAGDDKFAYRLQHIAALLAKVGQGWIPIEFNMTNYPVARHLGEWDTIDRKREDGKIFRFTLPPLPGASDD